MSVSNNVKLEIKTGDGISQAIDRQLDKQFNTDVKLSLKEWNTVFDIVKQDQATEQKQYSGEDSDISNASHYKVQTGFYELTQNAWNQIVNIVNNKLGLQTKEEETEVVEENPEITEEEVVEEESPTDAVKRILNERGIEADDKTIEAVARKYPTMQAIPQEGLTIEDRVANYVKGLKGQEIAQNMALNSLEENSNEVPPIQLTAVKDALNNNSQEDFNNAYIEYAQAQIETYDINNNGKIELEEYLNAEKASSGENYIETSAKAVFSFLDQNNNDTIDVEEMAALIWTTSKINDTENSKTSFDITQDEVSKINDAFTTIGLNAYLKEANEFASDEQMEELKNTILEGIPNQELVKATLKNGYKGFKAHLNK